MKRMMAWMSIAVAALGAAAGCAGSGSRKPAVEQILFPFCIDWHDAKKRDVNEQAAMLKELGYAGVGHIWLDRVEERLASLDALGDRADGGAPTTATA